MMRRAIKGATTSRNAAPLKAACLSFSSNYTSSNERGGRKYAEKKAARVVYEEDEFTPPPQRNVKNHYAGLFKPRPKKISFTSKFDSVDMEAREPDLFVSSTAPKRHHQPSSSSSSKKWSHDRRPQKEERPIEAVEEEDDYVEVEPSKKFVANRKVAPVHKSVEAQEDDGDDVLRALEIPEEGDDDEVPSSYKASEEDERTLVRAEDNKNRVAAMEEEDEAEEEGDASMKVVREHPFFKDLVTRLNKDMIRFRKDIRVSGRYNAEVINTCVRPLLQLTDYPFTAVQIAHLANAINPAVLKSSLSDLHACRRLHLYRSRDTELLLDWSVEDFLRRRYEKHPSLLGAHERCVPPLRVEPGGHLRPRLPALLLQFHRLRRPRGAVGGRRRQAGGAAHHGRRGPCRGGHPAGLAPAHPPQGERGCGAVAHGVHPSDGGARAGAAVQGQGQAQPQARRHRF
ncbi:hypothetical protein STCU_10739 [Strigomonas culicis]|uniref:Uncharacterized protein n=1 Tax=Strigomonas culicis TaxID=28005 RepID=S9URL7_9TRYP|nr:hypothetical protein STCU_10739 [Strigomonas culicis]|eukprot:EPY17236.1 hypothetical protein STCU_10739 [Strigomonas culicis]